MNTGGFQFRGGNSQEKGGSQEGKSSQSNGKNIFQLQKHLRKNSSLGDQKEKQSLNSLPRQFSIHPQWCPRGPFKLLGTGKKLCSCKQSQAARLCSPCKCPGWLPNNQTTTKYGQKNAFRG